MVTRTRDNTRQVQQFPDHLTFITTSSLEPKPKTFSQAQKHEQWMDAMHKKINALLKNKTWTLVPPPLEQNIVGCKWVYKIKQKRMAPLNVTRHV